MENQEKEKLGRFFFRTLQKLVHQKNRLDQRLLEYQFDVFQSVIIALTGTERLLFNTLFARIAYLGIQLKLPSNLLYELHLYRKESQVRSQFRSYDEVYQLGLYLLGTLIKEQYHIELPTALEKELEPPVYERKEPKLSKFEHSIRGMITEYDPSMSIFKFIASKSPDKELVVSTLRLELFQSSIQLIKELEEENRLPVMVNIREIGIDKQGNLYPKWIILEPDFLVDVTSIAECFTPTGARPEYYLLHKFMPVEQSKYLLIGHIVNFILDELINHRDLEFNVILTQVFKLAPLPLSIIDDKTLVEIITVVKQHYHNLVRVLKVDFPGLELNPDQCVVEPSFYAPELGLQGRLDVLHQNNKDQSSIIELKSGSPFRENRYGLSANHYTQTLLYDLMIRSVYKMRTKPLNYILYSKLPAQNLRFAPTIHAAQMEAISLRNEILAIERQLIEPQNFNVIDKLKIANFPGVFGFLKEDIEAFENTYARLDETEKAYFKKMTAFVALEQHLAKIGIHGYQDNNGLAALWLESSLQKEQRFSIFTHLTIEVNESMKSPPLIVLQKTEKSNELANFRVGDIVILRPNTVHENEQLTGQVIRATLVEQIDATLVIRLRSKQYDQRFFKKSPLWRMEHDFLDSGFRKMFQSLYLFSSAPESKRKLLLGRKAPEKPLSSFQIGYKDHLTENQNKVLQNMLNSPEYFLLWGPPGTGKTSIMLASAIEELMERTDESILLLAYTNRAVDEICEMIGSLEGDIDYLRIGSRYSTGSKYKDKLLDTRLEGIQTRKELLEMLSKTRIITGTTSSVSGKMEIFSLKQFGTIFIDEATQILEPMILGLLPMFKKFVLIGDHKQLPAVVVQGKDRSHFNTPSLSEIGIHGGHIALFDRMYHQCIKNNWNWAIGQLFEQGRMHSEIMELPGKVFYDSRLKVLPGLKRLKQTLRKRYNNQEENNFLLDHRMLFLNVKGDDDFELAKNNQEESKKVIKLIKKIEQLYAVSGIEFKPDSIGVITPFRAQVAQIRQHMVKENMDPSRYTIDTVERYQGGAREIIIFSTVVNSEKRLQQILAEDELGVDRKLNVALTRAKEQFILVGNKTILHTNWLYKQLLTTCKEIQLL